MLTKRFVGTNDKVYKNKFVLSNLQNPIGKINNDKRKTLLVFIFRIISAVIL